MVTLPEGLSAANIDSATSVGDFSVLIAFNIGDRSVVDEGLAIDDLSFRERFIVEDLSMRPSAPIALGPTLGEPMPTPSGFLTASSTGEEVLLKILKFDCYINNPFEKKNRWSIK